MKLAVGIDIGGTKTKVGLVNQEGVSIARATFRTKDFPEFDDYLEEIVNSIRRLQAGLDGDNTLLGIGIGAPNASSKRGTIENAANLLWKGRIPITELLGKKIDLPIKLMNDASAAALGEMMFGRAKGMKDFMVITLGTGLGSGIVSNGQLIEGYDGMAGELGHFDLTLGDGRMTGLGVDGGLEAYVSATGLKRTLLHMMCHYPDESIFRSIAYNDFHGEEITEAAENGDPIAIRAFEYTGKILGHALANFVTFTQPEAIFLMGGLTSSGKWLFEPTNKYMEAHLIDIYKGKVKLLKSGMHGKNAAIAGAASLIWVDHEI